MKQSSPTFPPGTLMPPICIEFYLNHPSCIRSAAPVEEAALILCGVKGSGLHDLQKRSTLHIKRMRMAKSQITVEEVNLSMVLGDNKLVNKNINK